MRFRITCPARLNFEPILPFAANYEAAALVGAQQLYQVTTFKRVSGTKDSDGYFRATRNGKPMGDKYLQIDQLEFCSDMRYSRAYETESR